METIDFGHAAFYKYRSLNDFERFLDIVLKKRLYGALYRELNDPMEGKFNHIGLSQEQLNGIYPLLKKTRVCSLMLKSDKQICPDNFLMWSHYADGHKGCCIEVVLTKKNNLKWKLVTITYSDKLPFLQNNCENAYLTILSSKSDLWKDEKEVRAIRLYDEKNSQNLSPYYAVKVKAIYLGCKVPYARRQFIKRIVQSIDKSIRVFKMVEDDSSVALYPTLNAKEI